MRLLCFVLPVLAMIGLQGSGGKVSNNVVVFWIPPQVETYIPVTSENIEKMAFKVVTIKNERQADEVLRLIQESNKAVDAKRIRIKISNGEQFYDFDGTGIGVSSKGRAVKIDVEKLKRVLCE
jgi:hypothetical protein